MKRFKMNLTKTLTMLLMFTMAIACSKDDDSDKSVSDPEGTMSMVWDSRSNDILEIGYAEIELTHQSNLVAKNCEIAYIGEMKGLGNVVKIPQSGWTTTAAANPNTGYVVRLGDGSYGRIFISDITTGTFEEKIPMIGGTWHTFTKYIANTKYQYPFNP